MIEQQTSATIDRTDHVVDQPHDLSLHPDHSFRAAPDAAPVLRAAFYARVSSEQQAHAGTIDSQIALLEQRIAQDGLVLDEPMRFIDDGYSGATLIRPALERLRDAAASGVIDRLYVACPDRLARKCALQMVLCDELERLGTQVVFLNRAIGQSPEDALLLQVQGVVAEYERAKINERCRRGKLHAAQRGSVAVLARAPFGYRFVPRSQRGGEALFNVHLEEAQVVRQIFHWIGVEGQSIRQACKNLEKQGVLNARGQMRWSPPSLWSMLRNPAYKGQAAYGKRRSGPMRPRLRPRRGSSPQPRRPRSVFAVPPEQWLSIPVPAIVEPELFDTVARQLEENRQRRRQRHSGAKHLLQGLVVCARCGYAYSTGSYQPRKRHAPPRPLTPDPHAADDRAAPRDRHATPQPRAYYRCCGAVNLPEQHTLNHCHRGLLRADRLEAAVWNDLCSLLQDPQRLQAEVDRRLQANSGDAQPPEIKRLQSTIAALRNGIARLIDAYQDALLEKSEFESRMTSTRTRLAALQTQLQSQEQAQASAREMRLVIDNLQSFAARVKTGLSDADWETRRQLVCTLIKRIEVEPSEVRVIYKFDLHPFDTGPSRGLLQDCTRRQKDTTRSPHRIRSRVSPAPWHAISLPQQVVFGRFMSIVTIPSNATNHRAPNHLHHEPTLAKPQNIFMRFTSASSAGSWCCWAMERASPFAAVSSSPSRAIRGGGL